ncbi:glucokinase [Stenotrophomonas pictorum JCM 9942]|uniref:Glucokinase n=1 Tax=Stenotrophomonas pictorum JCM 9942 TaxID=1236960 RepID=A0A0R0AK43_9GAMM|nr:glucokinase family protein [Stenotrophomonas pictorum]KRG44857.1 glucokinase [Stenotrophomonas pictorum JCM 9942]
MTAVVPPQQSNCHEHASRPFFAADVGGTHVRVGLIQTGDGDRPAIDVLSYRKYRCADYPGLDAILSDFASHNPTVADCVIATAGYALADGSVISANLPWPLSSRKIREDLGFKSVYLVNDFEAVAHAAAHIDDNQVLQLTGPSQTPAGPTLVIGPGTGLGAALWIPAGTHSMVLPTEAGQASLAATTELEMAVLQQMLRTRPHVSIEHALSGPGLLNLYNALCAVRDITPIHITPDAVSAAACDGSDPHAVEALHLFCGILGSTIGDMALLYGVQGGIYLAGGILPKISQFLLNSTFVERFLNKGPMRKALQSIPVKLVEHGQLGVIGAASWYLEKSAKQAHAA